MRGMKRFIIKHRKGLSILAAFLFLPSLYGIAITTVHIHNARYKNTFENLTAAARSNGLLVHSYMRANQPANLSRFNDESKQFKTSWGSTTENVGYKDLTGEIIIPSIFKFGDKGFHEGLAWVVTEDNRRACIRPDGTIVFTTNADYVQPFFNGRARIRRKSNPSEPFPWLLKGFIDREGNTVVAAKYYDATQYIGELDGEYVLVNKTTIFTSIYDSLMDGIDIDIPPVRILFPPSKALFLDKDGNTAPISEVRASIKRLKEQAKLKQSQ